MKILLIMSTLIIFANLVSGQETSVSEISKKEQREKN
jgi:hypothetical protein